MKSRIKEYLFNGNGVILAIIFSFFGSFVYFVFLRDDYVIDENVETSNTAIQQYITNQTLDNAKFALNKLAKCYARVNTWDCSSDNEKAFIKALAATNHVDLLFSNSVSTASDLKRGLRIEASTVMAHYTGKVPDALLLKANTLVRNGDIREAHPIYQALFAQGMQRYVAISLRSIFKHYGCIEDVEIWGEFSASEISVDTQPPGSIYPEQPRIYSVDEIVDRRIRLRNGEFIAPSDNCPINRMLKIKANNTERYSP